MSAVDEDTKVLLGHQVVGTMPIGPSAASQQCGCDGTWRSGPQHAAHLALAVALAGEPRPNDGQGGP